MYTLSVTNNAKNVKLTTSDGQGIAPGATWSVQRQGDAWVSSQQYGTCNFHDLGDTHVPGDSRETWGVLISYQGEEFVGRYEGEGNLVCAFNDWGQFTLAGMDLRQVSLPGLSVA